MELALKAERKRVEQELRDLHAQLSELDTRRQELVNEIVRREGMLMLLDRLDNQVGQ